MCITICNSLYCGASTVQFFRHLDIARKIEEIESESLRECKQDEGIVKSRFVLLNMVEPQFNGVHAKGLGYGFDLRNRICGKQLNVCYIEV